MGLTCCTVTFSVAASEVDGWSELPKNTISFNYDHAEQSEYFRLSYERHFDSGWYAWVEAAQEELEIEEFDDSRSYALQLRRELNFPWLASIYANHWDGSDAVENTVYELQFDRVIERGSVGLHIGTQQIQLTGARLQGGSFAREFSSTVLGTELRYYPTQSLELSFRYSHYTHDFDAAALNVTDRPSLILFLSPDTFGVIDSLDNWSVQLDANVLRGAWLWGARLGISESAVEQLNTQSVSAYAEYEFSSSFSMHVEITQQRTETYDKSNQIGIGTRFSF